MLEINGQVIFVFHPPPPQPHFETLCKREIEMERPTYGLWKYEKRQNAQIYIMFDCLLSHCT